MQELRRRPGERERLERRAHQAGQHGRAGRPELDDPARAEPARRLRRDERALGVDPADGSRDLAREQLDDEPPGAIVGLAFAGRAARQASELVGQRERPPDEVRDPATLEPAVVDRADQPLELGAQARDGRRQQRRVKRHVDPRQDPQGVARQQRGQPLERRQRAGHADLAAKRVLVDDLDALDRGQLAPGARRVDDRPQLAPGARGVDDRHPVGGCAICLPRHAPLDELAAPEDELDRSLEPQHAQRVQRRELADAVPGNRTVDPRRTGLAQLGELRRGERQQRGLRELRAVQHPVGMAAYLAARKP